MPKILLQGTAVQFAHPQQMTPLFQDLNFFIHDQSRIGLIGDNGVGKSTFLKLLTGALLPQQGQLERSSQLKIAHWRQGLDSGKPADTCKLSVEDFIWQARPRLAHLRQRMDKPETLSSEQLLAVITQFEAAGGYDFEGQALRLFSQYGLSDSFWNRPLNTLSGGEQARVQWCQLGLQAADLYLLDEPANHLDASGLEQLEAFLATSALPFVVVSHDRYLLEHCCTQIWQLKAGQLVQRQGTLSDFEQAQQEEQHRLQKQSVVQDKALARLEQAARQQRQQAERQEHFKPKRSLKNNGGICKRDEGSAKASLKIGRVMRKAKAMEQRMERMADAIERPDKQRQTRLKFQTSIDRERPLLRVSSSAGAGVVLRGRPSRQPEDWVLYGGERWAIIGANGSGKTTLMARWWQAYLDRERDDGVVWNQGLRVAYLPQTGTALNRKENALDWVLQAARHRTEVQAPALRAEAQTLLACLHIKGILLTQPLAQLSFGERQRVALAGLLIQHPDCLCLDEPTNHLSLSARQALQEALLQYTGALVLISHDRAFCNALVPESHRIVGGNVVSA